LKWRKYFPLFVLPLSSNMLYMEKLTKIPSKTYIPWPQQIHILLCAAGNDSYKMIIIVLVYRVQLNYEVVNIKNSFVEMGKNY